MHSTPAVSFSSCCRCASDRPTSHVHPSDTSVRSAWPHRIGSSLICVATGRSSGEEGCLASIRFDRRPRSLPRPHPRTERYSDSGLNSRFCEISLFFLVKLCFHNSFSHNSKPVLFKSLFMRSITSTSGLSTVKSRTCSNFFT